MEDIINLSKMILYNVEVNEDQETVTGVSNDSISFFKSLLQSGLKYQMKTFRSTNIANPKNDDHDYLKGTLPRVYYRNGKFYSIKTAGYLMCNANVGTRGRKKKQVEEDKQQDKPVKSAPCPARLRVEEVLSYSTFSGKKSELDRKLYIQQIRVALQTLQALETETVYMVEWLQGHNHPLNEPLIRVYGNHIPKFLQCKPYLYIKHVLERYYKAKEEFRHDNIIKFTDDRLLVSGSEDKSIWYEVNFKEVTCSCPDFIEHKQICKHFCAVFIYSDDLRFDDLPDDYRHSLVNDGMRELTDDWDPNDDKPLKSLEVSLRQNLEDIMFLALARKLSPVSQKRYTNQLADMRTDIELELGSTRKDLEKKRPKVRPKRVLGSVRDCCAGKKTKCC